jgi:DNA-binding transcriptional LysR family regulator
MVTLAQSVLNANDRVERYFSEAKFGGLRSGTSEDVVAASLADLLRQFRRLHPLLDVELTVGLSGFLNTTFEAGELDLVLAKRPPAHQLAEAILTHGAHFHP